MADSNVVEIKIDIDDEKGMKMLMCLVMVDFLTALDKAIKNNRIRFEDPYYRDFFEEPGLLNEATLQMMFYAMLIIPREQMSDGDEALLKKTVDDKIDPFIQKRFEEGTVYYRNGKKMPWSKIKCCRNIRNAVTHSQCRYTQEEGKKYVTFYDYNGCKESPREWCRIKLTMDNAAVALDRMKQLTYAYWLKHWPKKEPEEES